MQSDSLAETSHSGVPWHGRHLRLSADLHGVLLVRVRGRGRVALHPATHLLDEPHHQRAPLPRLRSAPRTEAAAVRTGRAHPGPMDEARVRSADGDSACTLLVPRCGVLGAVARVGEVLESAEPPPLALTQRVLLPGRRRWLIPGLQLREGHFSTSGFSLASATRSANPPPLVLLRPSCDCRDRRPSSPLVEYGLAHECVHLVHRHHDATFWN